jgi:hypothetical protein
MAIKAAKAAAFAVWIVLAFWAFSLGSSSSFFAYNLPSRLPPFLAAFAAAVALPVSAHLQWQRVTREKVTPLRGWLVHTAVAAGSLVPLPVIAALLARAPRPWHLSGDDAMGVGIDFLLLLAAAGFSSVLLALAFLLARSER